MRRPAFGVLLLVLHFVSDVWCVGMFEVFGWKQIDYDTREPPVVTDFFFPTDEALMLRSRVQSTRTTLRPTPASALEADSYIAYNNVPMGVNHYKGRLFITVPRRRLGIPSTLNYIDLKIDGANHSPKLKAFPDLETNTLAPGWSPNPNRIISVYRTRIDVCDRLWFVDTGLLELPSNNTQVQRPSIWVVDLKTNKRLHRFEIPESVVATGPGLASITVDVDKNACDQAFAYIPDLFSNALYVYSLAENRIWTFHHNFFHFDPIQGDLSIGGQDFSWDDGIFSITLGNKNPDGFRTAYFHPMASTNEFTVSTQVLQEESNAARSYHGLDFQLLGSRGDQKQSTMHDFDPKTGIIFYAEIMQNGVGCWNTKTTPFSPRSHGKVASDQTKMIYPSDLTVDQEGNIWLMTNSMPIFIYSRLDPNVVNFRVWKNKIPTAVEGTACQVL